jgi:glycosyltransferase
MKVQVLISTVNPNPKELIEKMNIQTDAIIVCQCKKNDYEEVIKDNRIIKIFSFNEKGVGLSRNNCLQRSTADIVLFADDDEVLIDDYENKIIDSFNKYSKYDMLLFNIKDKNGLTYKPIEKRIRKYNSQKYGTITVAVKREKVFANNIYFSLMFGPGAIYGSGEDSIFIRDCLNAKFKIHSVSDYIATLVDSESTWFNGYNEKYYFDKGALLKKLHGSFAILFCFIYLFRHRKIKTNLTFKQCYKAMINGIKDYSRKM